MKQIKEQQKRYLRGLGHKMKPVVLLGKSGFNDQVFEEITSSLSHHELIKVKINAEDRNERKKITSEIINRSQALLIQSVGNVILMYKSNPDNPRITFP
ncbi:MAG: ribosome assembly RNA-binding protein YhbY [Gammaproteobacteria bacterium]|nr:ribosome assembly RNA-binding protein YhbY [Gammaproteobacteria bacterium]